MAAGLDSYDSGTKATWRGWQWNRIVERLPEFANHKGPIPINNTTRAICAEKTVLYLCGPDDCDREHGRRFGFRDENMIAVDYSKDNIEKVKRGEMCFGIDEPLERVLMAWPSDWPIDVIISDLCCGFHGAAERVMLAVGMAAAVSPFTVLSVNMQRGREPNSSSATILSREIASSSTERQNEARRFFKTHRVSEKHRGIMFYLCLIHLAKMDIDQFSVNNELVRFALDKKPSCYSYKSPPSFRIWMDSVVFKLGSLSFGSLIPTMYGYKKSRILGLNLERDGTCWVLEYHPDAESKYLEAINPIRRRIRAMRAIRTMKINQMVEACS